MWFNNILTNLQVLCFHACAFWYRYSSHSKSLEFLLEHMATDSNTPRSLIKTVKERLFAQMLVIWILKVKLMLYFIPNNLKEFCSLRIQRYFYHTSPYFSTFIILWNKNGIDCIWNKAWKGNMSMEVITGEETVKVWWTVGSSSASFTLFIDGCL